MYAYVLLQNLVTCLTSHLCFPQLNDTKQTPLGKANKSVKSSCTVSSSIRSKRFLELLEAFEYSAVLQIFIHGSCEKQTCSQLQCMYSPKQVEKWLQVWGNVPRLIRTIITRSVHFQDNMQCMGLQQLQIYVSTDDHCFAKH